MISTLLPGLLLVEKQIRELAQELGWRIGGGGGWRRGYAMSC